MDFLNKWSGNDFSLPKPEQLASGRSVFAFHFNDWKQNFFRDFLSTKEVIFVPHKLEKNLSRYHRWLEIISKNPSIDFYIWGMNLPEFAKSLPNPKFFVEDGFIRSVELGSNRTLPFSLTIDSVAPYFDSTKQSELEHTLSNFDFKSNQQLIERSKKVIKKIIDAGISKYNNSKPIDNIEEHYGKKKKYRVLVIGQVEDDASIKFGSINHYTNNDLVKIARTENPDAEIFYKPHPDVIAKKRRELSDPYDVKDICKILLVDIPLAQAFETIDHVYTITSQAGFEALLRGIKVTTLGAPFYSGWGLTDDRQKIERRKRTLKLEELFAISYIKYPFYFNPFTKEKIEIEDAIDCIIALRKTSLNS